MNLVKSFAENSVGRDFVVGDVHGCFSILAFALRAVGFNEDTDRLFSVGDLVDRGPESEKVVDWLLKPWFHAVRGNHEQMVIDAELGGYGKTAAEHLAVNGGRWFLGLPPENRRAIAGAFALLPIAIEVQHPSGLVGIVHAEPPGLRWHDFIGALEVDSEERERVIACALWSRSRINYQVNQPVAGVARVFVGHTPVREVLQFGNVIYIDTGCVFGRRLALFELDGTAAVYVSGASKA